METRKLREIHLERNGTTTFAGEEMVRYTAQGVEDAPSGMGAIAAYRTAVLVDDDGLVRVVETRFVERNDRGPDRLSSPHGTYQPRGHGRQAAGVDNQHHEYGEPPSPERLRINPSVTITVTE